MTQIKKKKLYEEVIIGIEQYAARRQIAIGKRAVALFRREQNRGA